jgi:hypothetical protein
MISFAGVLQDTLRKSRKSQASGFLVFWLHEFLTETMLQMPERMAEREFERKESNILRKRL